MVGIGKLCMASALTPNALAMRSLLLPTRKIDPPQIVICVNPTSPTPTTLPRSIWNGVSDDARTSMMREVFSSITDVIVCWPYKMMPM